MNLVKYIFETIMLGAVLLIMIIGILMTGA